jgi:hypothetical protein
VTVAVVPDRSVTHTISVLTFGVSPSMIARNPVGGVPPELAVGAFVTDPRVTVVAPDVAGDARVVA